MTTKDRFKYILNREALASADPVVDGRKLLRSGKFDPADEHVLIQLLRPGSKSIGLDEEVDLREPGQEEFQAFLSDRVFSFTVDGRGYEWGTGHISEPDLRDIAGVPADLVLMLERGDEPDELLDPGNKVDLGARGTEHIRTGKRLVTVFYKDEPFELKPGVYTTEQLIEIFKVPDGYQLDIVKKDGEFDELAPRQKLKIKDGMHFVSHPPCGQSS